MPQEWFRYHLLPTEPLKNQSGKESTWRKLYFYRERHRVAEEPCLGCICTVLSVFKGEVANACLYTRSYLGFLPWLNPACPDCIKKAARVNAQMFLCVTASSWQKDLQLETCWFFFVVLVWFFAVWVQTEDQEHREIPAVCKVGVEQRKGKWWVGSAGETGGVSDGRDEELMVTLGFVPHVSCGGLDLHSIWWGDGGVREREQTSGVHPGHDFLCVLMGNTSFGAEPDHKTVAKIQEMPCYRVTLGPFSTTERANSG